MITVGECSEQIRLHRGFLLAEPQLSYKSAF